MVELIGVYRNLVGLNAPEDQEERQELSANPADNDKPEALILARSLAILDVFERLVFTLFFCQMNSRDMDLN